MKFSKRSLVLGALVVALGLAVYLNWQFSLPTTASNDKNTTKELGKAQYATASYIKDTDATEDTEEDTDVMFNLSGNNFFKEAKINRDETQQKIVDLATEVLKSTENDDKARTEAVASASEYAKIIGQQNNIETLIKAKGFDECLAFIQDDECSIIVNKGVLNESLAIIIKDIVNSSTGITFDKIIITEA